MNTLFLFFFAFTIKLIQDAKKRDIATTKIIQEAILPGFVIGWLFFFTRKLLLSEKVDS
jgi:hypothetical protein